MMRNKNQLVGFVWYGIVWWKLYPTSLPYRIMEYFYKTNGFWRTSACISFYLCSSEIVCIAWLTFFYFIYLRSDCFYFCLLHCGGGITMTDWLWVRNAYFFFKALYEHVCGRFRIVKRRKLKNTTVKTDVQHENSEIKKKKKQSSEWLTICFLNNDSDYAVYPNQYLNEIWWDKKDEKSKYLLCKYHFDFPNEQQYLQYTKA